MKKLKVFLGGTCNNSKWREKLIPKLNKNIVYYNPVVANWTQTDYKKEQQFKKLADVCIYVVTPKLKGFYTIAEAVGESSSHHTTIFSIINKDENEKFTLQEKISLAAVTKMIKQRGGRYMPFSKIAKSLNSMANIKLKS